MSSIRVGGTNQGRFFTSKNPEHAQNFERFSGTGPDFQSFTSQQDPFLITWSQSSKMAVAFLKNDRSNPNFLKRSVLCVCVKRHSVPVTITISKLYSNKLMLPVGALASCSLMLTYSRKKE